MLQWHLWLCFSRMCLPSSCWREALWLSHKWGMRTWYIACTWSWSWFGGLMTQCVCRSVPHTMCLQTALNHMTTSHHSRYTHCKWSFSSRTSCAQTAIHSSTLRTPTEEHWALPAAEHLAKPYWRMYTACSNIAHTSGWSVQIVVYCASTASSYMYIYCTSICHQQFITFTCSA